MKKKRSCIPLVLHVNDNSGLKTIQKQSFVFSKTSAPKTPANPRKKKTPAPELLLKTLFKKKPHRRRPLRESVETFKNTPNTEHPQRQLSTIIRTKNIFCSIKQTANKHKR